MSQDGKSLDERIMVLMHPEGGETPESFTIKLMKAMGIELTERDIAFLEALQNNDQPPSAK